MMDVTELKEREAAVAEEAKSKRRALANEAAANEANRLKSQFLANVRLRGTPFNTNTNISQMSHEIRTPISGVLGMAELLGNILDQPEQQEYLDNIQRSANALLTVINDILDFSKVESGRLDLEEVQFSLSLVVQDVSKMLSFAASRKDLRFDSDIGGEVEDNLVVIGDPGRVRQIITNLLTNSIKFTTQGYVRFSVQKERETDKMVEIKFTIQDSGIGIKEEVRRRLFRPFSQGDASTARRFGGTGLGLTICKNLVELMHGRISLESTLGHGTTATFWIPFAKLQGPSMSPLVHIDSLPERLQCEMSVSCASSDRDISTPAASDLGGSPDKNPSPRRQKSVSSGPATEVDLPLSERAKILVLVVEDK
jgi:signal transduction histidine kinase